MAHVYVIGAGMVGSAMALDLAKDHQVSLGDICNASLGRTKKRNTSIQTTELDVRDTDGLKTWLEPADLVLCAVPGFMGWKTLKTVIEAGKNAVDISFMPEDAQKLFALAKEKDITVVVDSGVAPGIPNFLIGYHDKIMVLDSFEYRVGGLPKNPRPPFNYKASFSPLDVIEEYIRPARMMVGGKLVTKPALSELEKISIPPVGELEAFNTDGLRSLLTTMSHIPNMKEKTLRYPGHANLMRVFKDSGFFSDKKLNLKGKEISPLELTSELLFKEWKLGPEEPEFTIMDITFQGFQGDVKKEINYVLYDEYNLETKTSSMVRTTGYTATAAVNLLLDGIFQEKGLFPPEILGGYDDCLNFILEYLKNRGVVLKKGEKTL